MSAQQHLLVWRFDEPCQRIISCRTRKIQIILLNDLLSIYGPETNPTRTEARQFVEDAVNRILPSEKTQSFELKPANTGQNFYKQLEMLEPKNGAQASAKAQLISLLLVLKKDLLADVSSVTANYDIDSLVGGSNRQRIVRAERPDCSDAFALFRSANEGKVESLGRSWKASDDETGIHI